MAKIEITLSDGKTVKLAPDAELAIIKTSEIVSLETGDSWDNTGPTILAADDYALDAITLEAGVTMVSAKLWADHIKAGSASVKHMLEADALTIFESVEVAWAKLSPGKLNKIVSVSRHGLALRTWLKLERDSKSPRRSVLKGLAERTRLFGNFAPVQFGALGHVPKVAAKVVATAGAAG